MYYGNDMASTQISHLSILLTVVSNQEERRKEEKKGKKKPVRSRFAKQILNSGSYQVIGRKWEHFLFVTAWWTQVLRNNRAGFRSVHVWWHPGNVQSGPDFCCLFVFFVLCSIFYSKKPSPGLIHSGSVLSQVNVCLPHRFPLGSF